MEIEKRHCAMDSEREYFFAYCLIRKELFEATHSDKLYIHSDLNP